MFKSCSNKYQGDGPTGVLLVYPQHCVHLLEAPAEIINTIVIDLKELESKGYVEPLIQHVAIIIISLTGYIKGY